MARAAAAFLGALACLLRIETMAWVCGARQKIGIVNGCGTERLHVYVGESRKKRVGSGTEIQFKFKFKFKIQSVGVRNTLGWGWQVDELRGQLAVHSRRRDRAFFFPGKDVHTAITAPNLLVPRASAVLPETTHGGHRTQL